MSEQGQDGSAGSVGSLPGALPDALPGSGWPAPVVPDGPGQVVQDEVRSAPAVEVGVGSQAATDGGPGAAPGGVGEGRSGGAGGRRRRRLAGEQVRSQVLRVRVSQAERAVISEAAAAAGVSVGAWLAGVGLRAAVTGAGEPDAAGVAGGGPVGGSGGSGELSAALAGLEGAPPAGGSRPVVVSGTDEAVEALRQAVVALNRYGRLLNQLVVRVNAGEDPAGLAEGLQIAVTRCWTQSGEVATRAGFLTAVVASPVAVGGAGPASGTGG